MLGHISEEGHAALLATTLHAQGLSVINDIDHVDWELVPIDKFGLGLTDVQVLNMTKLGNDEIAHQLIVNAQVKRCMPKPAEIKRVVNEHAPFDFRKWMSRQHTPKEGMVKQEIQKTLVIGSTEKTFMKPVTEASRIAFEKKLQKRWALMQSKPP